MSLPVTSQKGVDLNFSSVDFALKIDDFSDRFLRPAMSVLASQIDYDALSMTTSVANSVGTPGTTPATYQTFGAWTENGGRAVANSANSPAVSNSPFDSNTTNRHTARINSNTQPLSQSTNGLKIDDNIAVYGLFDLSSTLDKNDSSYNIRLRDSGFGQSPNDDARVGVRRTDSGNLIVRFGDFDSDAGTFNILDSDVFAPDANDDQIVLALSRSAPDGGNTNPGVTASYAFVDGTVDLSDMVALSNLSFTSLNGAVTLFGDEDWTRADIAVFEAVEVAEPGMIAIILAAVGVMGIARRRQQT